MDSINSVNSNKGTVDFSSVSRPNSNALTAHGSNERLGFMALLSGRASELNFLRQSMSVRFFRVSLGQYSTYLSELKSTIIFNELF